MSAPSDSTAGLTPAERAKQEHYRDARFTDKYDDIWQSVGKCVFCDLRDKYIFFEENGVVMTVSLFAYIDGHFMIVPRRHVRSPKELSQLEWDTVRKFTYIAKKLIKDVHGVKGMQLLQKDGSNAQSTVDQHLHFHCIPFDAPDLSVWNYRKLRDTPLESAERYRRAGKKLLRAAGKFNEKYRQPHGRPMICDLIIINQHDEVLVGERADAVRMTPPCYTLPGGHVSSDDTSLESALAREIREELGISLAEDRFELLASRLGRMTYHQHSSHLQLDYTEPATFFWNTYIMRGFDGARRVTPGDDLKAVHWLPLTLATGHSMLTEEVRGLLASISP